MQPVRTTEEAEARAAADLRERGFADATVLAGAGAHAGPGALAVFGAAVAAAVRYAGPPVGRSEVLALARAPLGGVALAYFSASGFTDDAVLAAGERGVALFTWSADAETVPLTEAARTLRGGAEPAATTSGGRGNTGRARARRWPAVQAALAPLLRVLRRHWPLIGAIVGTAALLVVPFGDQAAGLRAVVTVAAVAIAPVSWMVLWQRRRARTERVRAQ